MFGSNVQLTNSFGSRSGNSKKSTYAYGSAPFIRTNNYAGLPHHSTQIHYDTIANKSLGKAEVQNSGKSYTTAQSKLHQAINPFLGGSAMKQTIQPYGRIRVDEPIIEKIDTDVGFAKRENPCFEFNLKFMNCLRENNNDTSACQNLLDDLKVCEDNLKKFR